MFSEINKIVAVLEAGGVILYPTDTIWGLGCDATNALAVAKIFEIKQRVAHKSMIVLLAEAKDVFQYAVNPPLDIIGTIKGFTQPTTVVYDAAVNLAPNVLASDGSIGIRVTTDAFCKIIIKRMKKPLVSTSANISGHNSPRYFKDIDPELLSLVDYVVNYRQDDETPSEQSSIIRFMEDGSINTIR